MTSSLSLYLKFSQLNENTIQFGTKQYRFKKIINDDTSDPHGFLQTTAGATGAGVGASECYILLGPTGSGKTTTMSQVLEQTITSFGEDRSISMTAFEVIDNKIITDLLDENLKKEYNITFESQLKTIQAPNRFHLQQIFSHRTSFKTSANPISSRSCLVVTFHYGDDSNRRMTFIDMMGNEKYDKHTSNVFANLNMSSITELLVKKSNGYGGRSSNLVTNLIFKKDEQNHIKLILHLDPKGDASLTKSALNNIALLVHKFKLEMQRVPSSKSNHTTSKSSGGGKQLPSYARPTISSSSTTPSLKVTKTIHKSKSIRKLNQTSSSSVSVSATTRAKALKVLSAPAKNILLEKPVDANVDLSPQQLLDKSKSYFNSECSRSPISRPASSPIRSRISKAPDTKFKSMREKLMEKTFENDVLRKENLSMVELLEKTRRQINEYSELAVIEQRREELERQRLLEAKREIMEQVDAFKTEFYIFKDTHESFNDTVEKLKTSLASIEVENRVLKSETDNLKSEFSMKEESLIISNRELKSEIEQLNNYLLNERSRLSQAEKENNALNQKVVDLDTRNTGLSQQYTRVIGELEEQIAMNKEIKASLEQELSEQVGSKDLQISNLQEQLTKYDSVASERDAQLDKKEKLIVELEDKLALEQTKSNGIITELKQQLLISEEKVHATRTELEASNTQVVDSNTEIERLTKLVKDLEDSSNETKRSLEQIRDQALGKDDELAVTKEKMLEYEEELLINRKELQKLKETHGEANNELLTTMAELEMAEKALEFKQNELKVVETEKSSLAEDLEALQQRNCSMKKELDELKAQQVPFEIEQQNIKLKAELEQLKVARNFELDNDDELKKLRTEVAEIEHLKDVLESKEVQIAQLKVDNEESKSGLQGKVNSLSKEKEELLNSLTQMKTKYSSVNQELKAMKKDALNNNKDLLSASPQSSILATSSPNSPIMEESVKDDIITTPIVLEAPAPLKKPFDAKQIFRDRTSSKSPTKHKKDNKHVLTPSNRNMTTELNIKKDKKLKRKHSDFKLNANKLQRAVL
ncbi:uncharacterized protein KQ657_001490 [Scheffersomyces spartinae]|uniref:Kinesin motor domain-containing protein n=1 Tax=Scheffersomyces spartinae TaxID=45513 RepID=A0A9P7V7P1_9ASCO|nr:uncharacterized protein KQ657_001490 [Scheffersomyces spartinae]KAG7192707.1 hypothetical protein KQ657_001490 [Scheffersomyces spartinae]